MTPEEARKLRVLCEMAQDFMLTFEDGPVIFLASGEPLIMENVFDGIASAIEAGAGNAAREAFAGIHPLVERDGAPTDPYQDWLTGGDT